IDRAAADRYAPRLTDFDHKADIISPRLPAQPVIERRGMKPVTGFILEAMQNVQQRQRIRATRHAGYQYAAVWQNIKSSNLIDQKITHRDRSLSCSYQSCRHPKITLEKRFVKVCPHVIMPRGSLPTGALCVKSIRLFLWIILS